MMRPYTYATQFCVLTVLRKYSHAANRCFAIVRSNPLKGEHLKGRCMICCGALPIFARLPYFSHPFIQEFRQRKFISTIGIQIFNASYLAKFR
jgi:hypothetical protein